MVGEMEKESLLTFVHKHVIKCDTPSRQIQSRFEREAEPGPLLSNGETFSATSLYTGCHYL